MQSSRLDVAQGLGAILLDLLGTERSYEAGGNPGDECPGLDDLSRTDDCTGCHQGVFAYFGPVEHDRPDPDQRAVAHATAMHHGTVADRDLIAEDGGIAIGCDVQGGLVLDIGPFTDPDPLDVGAQHRAEEDARILPDLDITDHRGPGRDPHRGMQPWPGIAEGAQDGAGTQINHGLGLGLGLGTYQVLISSLPS